jgi:2-polyprenyl-3-methyl-5-hydroxy-6-metoxy-1,4-benzoquinol methylase
VLAQEISIRPKRQVGAAAHIEAELSPATPRRTSLAAVMNPVERLRKERPDDIYLAFHAPRYKMLLGLLQRQLVAPARVLDIGRSTLSTLIARQFRVTVDTLGFSADEQTDIGHHWKFDLNDAQFPERWRRDFGPFDVIVMAEVIEHLHTSPALVLRFLKTLLADSGILIVQTPNAASLHKRIKLLLGRNPYDLIVEDVSNPLHFREYTKAELVRYLEGAGFDIVDFVSGNYFDYRYPTGSRPHRPLIARIGAINMFYRFMPALFKPGFTVVARAKAATAAPH